MEMDDGDKLQSETGRREGRIVVVNACSSSPLFYTVSGLNNGESQPNKSKYIYEQLGCPSILKPSFRDLPGCTRLSSSSVGVPSALTSYRQFPLDRLNTNKTIMGKSPTSSSSGKREKCIAPIKMNTRIRHVYSHITTSGSSSISDQSSLTTTTISTQTDFDGKHFSKRRAENDQTIDEDLVNNEHVVTKDVSTSTYMPIDSGTYFDDSAEKRLFTVPPSYAGKLEDLEKITGHIVIQRFFTRADEAFGIWLEKQLGMNSKSIGIDTSEMNAFLGENKDPSLESFDGSSRRSSAREGRILEKILEVDDVFNSDDTESSVNKGDDKSKCNVNDVVKCECFLEYFTDTENFPIADSVKNVTSPNESSQLPLLDQIDLEILDQCVEYEILNNDSKPQPIEESNFPATVPHEIINSSSTKPVISDNNVQDDISNETELRLSKCLVESVLNELNNEEKDDVVTDEPDKSDERDEQENLTNGGERQCIPDVIDVSLLYQYQQQRSLKEESDEKLLSESQLNSQTKVAEYLGKLEISQSHEEEEEMASNTAPSPPMLSLEEHEGETRGESLMQMQHDEHLLSQNLEESRIKRSISADSCIGTESSGETRNTSTTTTANMHPTNLNDSGILLDSGRMEILEESEASEPSQRLRLEEDDNDNNSKESREKVVDESFELVSKVVKGLNNSKSMDEYSRSDLSSGMKNNTNLSDGDDADQSESDSDMGSLVRKLSAAPTNKSGGLAENEDELDELEDLEMEETLNDDGDDDEQDQFDTIIENHEKEKRLRPICRKRNVSTQTTKSVESSIVTSCNTTSRSTTATSDSSFDLEFVSKSKKYISHIPVFSTTGLPDVKKRPSQLPSGASGLNVLNLKFTMGKEFESEVSIRIPPKSPSISSTGSGCVGNAAKISLQSNSQTLPIISGKSKGQQRLFQSQLQDNELRNLWRDVKSKMDSRVGGGDEGESELSLGERNLQIRGRRMSLISSEGDQTLKDQQQIPSIVKAHPRGSSGGGGSTDVLTTNTIKRFEEGSVGLPALALEDDKIKRSLKRLKKILDD